MKVLVAGWFSFEQMGATAGDLLARDLVCRWLSAAGKAYDVALAPPFSGGVAWRNVEPGVYSDLIFVCGPFGNGPPLTEFLPRFAHCRLIGVNLTMLQSLETWNPFDILLERDSSRIARPDITFLSPRERVPLAGLVLIHYQSEYGDKSQPDIAHEAVQRLLDANEVAAVPIDTRLDENRTGLRTPREVESAIAGMDLVITTRLHGMVLALKNGVPALAIDSVAGGHKITRQAQAIGWPLIYGVDMLEDEKLQQGFEYCLTDDARKEALFCAGRAQDTIEDLPSHLINSLC